MSQQNQTISGQSVMSAYGSDTPSGIRFVDPAAAARHHRWLRAFYMTEARHSSTRHGREDAVAAAQVANMNLVSALRQVRHG